MSEWVSVHLHFEGTLYGPDGDRVLVDVVAPAIDAVRATCEVSCFFFIRYPEGGPHIRLRVAGRTGEARQRIRDALEADLRRRCRTEGVDLMLQTYEPEWARYGGRHGMAISERFFECSSKVAIAAAQEEPFRGLRDVRRANALLSAIVLVGALSGGDRDHVARGLHRYAYGIASFADRAGDEALKERVSCCGERVTYGLGQFVSEAWRRLCADEPLTPTLDSLCLGVRAARRALTAAQRRSTTTAVARPLIEHVQWSYLHMMNNRLGILPAEERFLAQRAAQALLADERESPS